MKDKNKLEEILNVEPVEQKAIEIVDTTAKPVEETEDTAEADSDYKEVRKNLKNLVEISEEAAEGLLKVAKEGDSPRAYEVVSDLLKTALEGNMKLMELHKKRKDIKKETAASKIEKNVTNNNMIMTNTKELLEMIKKNKKAAEITDGTE